MHIRLISPIHPQNGSNGQRVLIWLGMGMTEKQGGSDVRANETIAVPVAESGRGQA